MPRPDQRTVDPPDRANAAMTALQGGPRIENLDAEAAFPGAAFDGGMDLDWCDDGGS
jgi:hypothetical protein